MPRSDKLSHDIKNEEFFIIIKEIESFRSEEGKILFSSSNIKELLDKYNELKNKHKNDEDHIIEIIDRFNNPIWEKELISMLD